MSEVRLSVPVLIDQENTDERSNVAMDFVSEMYKTINELIRHLNTIHQTHGMISQTKHQRKIFQLWHKGIRFLQN